MCLISELSLNDFIFLNWACVISSNHPGDERKPIRATEGKEKQVVGTLSKSRTD